MLMETRDMLPYPPPAQLQPNPEGMAAVGAIVGLIAGGIVGSLVTFAFRPKLEVEVTADTPEEAQQLADLEAQKLLAKAKSSRRWFYLVNGMFATAGAAIGARVGALPHQKNGAMWGAIIGTGTMRMINVAFNPGFGFPGLIAGGVGAYVGARRAK